MHLIIDATKPVVIVVVMFLVLLKLSTELEQLK